MATIPTQHVVGDEGHTSDHNLIVDALTEHQTRIGVTEGEIDTLQSTAMLKSGGNTIAIANPSGFSEVVVIPAGTRESTAYVKQVTYGGNRTFALDPYGQPRYKAASVTDVPVIVHGFNSSHTGDLQRWLKNEGGATLARVAADGTIFAPNITPGTWTNLTFGPGVAWEDTLGARPSYRKIGDRVEIRGNIKKSNGTDFATSPFVIGTLPADFSPPSLTFSIVATQLAGSLAWARVEVQEDGVIECYLPSGHTPGWISIDGIWFSRTA